jgi:hypothetical protein
VAFTINTTAASAHRFLCPYPLLPSKPPALPLISPAQAKQAAGSQSLDIDGQLSEDEQLLGVMPRLAYIFIAAHSPQALPAPPP